jgi:hypothetical protein
LEEFKNELLQLARLKLGGELSVPSTRVDANAYSDYVTKLLNSLAAGSGR